MYKSKSNYYDNIKQKLELPYWRYNFDRLSQLADKVSWCWKWRKITEEQMNELAEEITNLFNYAK